MRNKKTSVKIQMRKSMKQLWKRSFMQYVNNVLLGMF